MPVRDREDTGSNPGPDQFLNLETSAIPLLEDAPNPDVSQILERFGADSPG